MLRLPRAPSFLPLPARPTHPLALALLVPLFVVAAGAHVGGDERRSSAVDTDARTQTALIALGVIDDKDARVVDLGRSLFHDPALSSNGKVSCATCHPLLSGGTTHDALGKRGVSGEAAPFNTPTIWNVVGPQRLGWRADADDVAMVVDRALTKSFLMGNASVDDVTARISNNAAYAARFQRAGLRTDRNGLSAALTAYIAHVSPKDAPADRFFAGDDNAISAEAKRGASLFRSLGCASCHAGTNVGGGMVARFGVVADPYADRGQCDDQSFCRSDDDCHISGGGSCRKTHVVRSVDEGVGAYLFRVPSLRCVAETAPYFHDGSARTLDEAVRVMARLQLGTTLDDDDARALVAFLGTLTGKIPAGEM